MDRHELLRVDCYDVTVYLIAFSSKGRFFYYRTRLGIYTQNELVCAHLSDKRGNNLGRDRIKHDGRSSHFWLTLICDLF